MSLVDILTNKTELQIIYLAEMTALQVVNFWVPDPTSPSTAYSTPYPWDSHAYITAVSYRGSALKLAVNESTVVSTPGTYFWDRTNLFVHAFNGDDPRAIGNTVTVQLTYYFSSHTAKIFNGIFYEPLLLQTPPMSLRVEQDFSGVGQTAGGAVIFDNSTGFFDQLTTLNWDAGQTRILLGADQPSVGLTMAYSDYVPIETWLNDSWSKTNQTFTMNTLELKQNLIQNIPQNIYDDSVYPHIMTNAIGKVIPIAYGQIFGAAPVCIDLQNYIFKLTDHAIYSIDEVRMATATSWKSIPFTPDVQNGQFTLSKTVWDGVSNISVDFHGRLNVDGSWMDNASDVMSDILTNWLKQGPLDSTSFTNSKNALIFGQNPTTASDQNAIYFPQPDSFVDGGTNAALDTMVGDFTIEAWVYQTISNTVTGNQGIVARDNFSAVNGPFALAFVSSLNTPLISLNGNVRLSANTPIPTNTWTHIAVTRTGSFLSFWINGVFNGSTTYGTPITYSGEPIHAGSFYVQDYSFRGYVNELRLSKICRYTGNFTPAQVLGNDANVVLYWRFNDGSGTTTKDSSFHNITGTLNGATTWVTRPIVTGFVSERVPSIYIDSPLSGTSFIQQLNQIVGSYLFIDGNGLYHYVVFLPQVGEGLTTFDQTSILNFQKDNPTIQCQSSVTAIFGYRLSDKWGEILTINNQATQFTKGQPAPTGSPQGPQIIGLATNTDATYWIGRQLVYYGKKPDIYSISLPWSVLLQLPSNYIHIQYPRHNIDEVFEIVQVVDNGNGLDSYQNGGSAVPGNSSAGVSGSGLQLVISNLHNYDNSVGFWVPDEGQTDGDLPTRFANLAGYGGRTDGQPDGSLVWYDAWDPQIKSWVSQNVGYWDDENGAVDTVDATSYGISVWF